VHAAQVEKAETEIKRLRGLNDMFEKDLEKLRGEMESAHTRRKVCIVIVLKIHTFTLFVYKSVLQMFYFMCIIYCAWCICKCTQSHMHAYVRTRSCSNAYFHIHISLTRQKSANSERNWRRQSPRSMSHRQTAKRSGLHAANRTSAKRTCNQQFWRQRHGGVILILVFGCWRSAESR
jgi:hypothetical protein